MEEKISYQGVTFMFGESRYNLGLAIDRFSMMAQNGSAIPDEVPEEKDTNKHEGDEWIFEEYELARNPIDDIKNNLGDITFVREKLMENGFVDEKVKDEPQTIHIYEMILRINELEERCNEFLKENFVLGDLSEDEVKEVVKYEDLIYASLNKIENEHEAIKDIYDGNDTFLKKPRFFN